MPMESADELAAGASSLAQPEDSASPSGQKRPRDYGAELKGLTPDRESEGEVQASPSPKRSKTAHTKEPEQSEPADHVVLEDSTPASDVATETIPSAALQQPTDSSVAPADDLRDGNVPIDQDDAVVEKTARQPSSNWNHGVSLGVRTSFGSSKLRFGTKPQSHAAKSAPSSKESPVASDKGTDDDSADKKGPESASEKADHSAASPDTGGPPQAENAEDQLTHKTSFECSDLTWTISCGRLSHKRIEARKVMGSQKYWKKYLNPDKGLEKLITALLEENYSQKDRISRLVIEAALDAVIADGQGLIRTPKKPKWRRSVFKRAAKEVLQTIEPVKFDEIFAHAESLARADLQQAKALHSPSPVGQAVTSGTALSDPSRDDDAVPIQSQPASQTEGIRGAEDTKPPENGTAGVAKAEETKAAESPTEEEMQYQMLYFPGAEVLHCIYCAGTTHQSKDCPQLTCEFCGSRSHSRFGCPTKRRCRHCHQFGHTEESCKEKLALTRSEMEPCAFCGADHVEEECTTIWRSFHPSESEIRKVKRIPDFCFTCGAMGHYGPECGLYRGEPLGPDTTWCRANYTKYVDPNSPDIALAWVDLDIEKINNQSTFHIRGKAHRQTHIHFVESDDSEEDFIKAPLKKTRPPRGEIRIASNILHGGHNGNGTRDRLPRTSHRQQREREFSPAPPPPQEVLQRPPYYENNGYQAYPVWQPPLPAGPPPPLPGQATYTSYNAVPPPPPPGRLPPRPDAYSYPQQSSRQSSSSAASGGRSRRGQRKKRL